MNVKFDEINTTDAAKLLGVTRTTVTYWCRKGWIKFQNVGEGNLRPRYLFTDDEVQRVMDLMKKYGKEHWHEHANEGFKAEANSRKAPIDPVIRAYVKSESKVSEPDVEMKDDDSILLTISKIRELKERRENLEAELTQVEIEIKLLKDEVMKALD
jgi:hydroxymethylpyrimidine pyrophosphatase-like HAD family hydrolase